VVGLLKSKLRNVIAQRVSEKEFKIGEYLAKLKANTLLKDEESARDNHGLACNFAPILFFFTRRQNFGHESVAPLFWPTLYFRGHRTTEATMHRTLAPWK